MTTSEFIASHRTEDVRRLALTAAPSGVDMPYALRQIEGWQTACRKLPTWAATEGVIYPPRLAMEQCSSEATARLKMKIICDLLGEGKGASHAAMVDLTGGYGVDFLTMAPIFGRATYVERQPDLVDMVRHNSTLLPDCHVRSSSLHFHVAEAEEFLRNMDPVDIIYIDPARRDAAGRKVMLIENCQPDVCALHDLLLSRCSYCLIKLSPMLDISAALRTLPDVGQVHVVSVQGECKEVLLLLSATAPGTAEPLITCHYSNANGGTLPSTFGTFAFNHSEEHATIAPLASSLHGYLYEPDAALLKAGCFRLIGQRFGVSKLAVDTHLYVADNLVPDFPGRVWRIKDHASFAKKELRALLNGIRCAEVATRNFPTNVATLRRQLRLADGNDAHLIATTLADGTHKLLKVEKLKD